MTLAATGVRGLLWSSPEPGGFTLALKAGAFWVRTESAGLAAPGIGGLAESRGESSRVVLDGSRTGVHGPTTLSSGMAGTIG